MRKNRYKRCFFSVVSILVLMLAWCPGIHAEPRLYTLSYSPGTLFHQLVRDRAKAMYEQAGIKAEFIPLPHNRSLISANEGNVDGDVGRVPSVEEKYPNLVRVNVKLMDLKGAVYTTREDLITYREEMLKTLKVGYVLGVRWTQKRMEGLDAVKVRDYPSLFEMLLEKRVDIVLATEASATSAIKTLGKRANTVRELQPFIFTAPIYHYVNLKNKEIVPLLEKTLVRMNEENYWESHGL